MKPRVMWMEDDARPPDAETLNQAWKRLVGRPLDLSVAERVVDFSDGTEYLMPGGWVVFVSYPGNSSVVLL